MRIDWLEIDTFRQVQPGTRLEFGPGVNVVMGQNGTGKTNLLKLLAAISRFDFGLIAGEEVSFRFGGLRGRSSFEVEVFADTSPPPTGGSAPWHIRATLSDPELETPIVIELSERASWVNFQGNRFDPGLRLGSIDQAIAPIIFFAATTIPGLAASEAALAAAMTFSAMYSSRLDEGLEVFNDLVSGERSTQPGGGGFEAALYHGESGVFLTPRSAPADFNLQLEKRGPEKEYLQFDQKEVACLEAARAAFGFAGLSAVIRRTSRQVREKTTIDTFKGITFRATLRDGTEFDHDRFSFGQKRMLTFLWYAAANVDGPIIADELANGLHHAWIDTCMRTIGDRQAFLATQNPLIFDFLEFASADEARVSLVRCSAGETESGAAQWRWNNLTTDEAERLFLAYEARFQHVSELLRVEGLW